MYIYIYHYYIHNMNNICIMYVVASTAKGECDTLFLYCEIKMYIATYWDLVGVHVKQKVFICWLGVIDHDQF